MDFAKVCAVALAGIVVGACHHDGPPATTVSPSAMLVGTKPAPPTADPPGTTAVASNTSEVSKAQGGPPEGNANSHSTLDASSPQKSGDQRQSSGSTS